MDADTYDKVAKAEEALWFYEGRRRIAARLIACYSQLPVNHMLDVGCGSGHTLQILGRAAQRVVGMDVSRQALNYSRQRGLSQLFEGDAAILAVANEAFDLVMALDVIEHCADDAAVLREMYRALRPGGLCYIMAPALMFLWSPLDMVAHHYRRYTTKELRERLQAAGFIICKVSYANTWLFPAVLTVRLLQRVGLWGGGQTADFDFEMPNPRLNRWLTALFASEANWLVNAAFPIGVSVLGVGIKPTS